MYLIYRQRTNVFNLPAPDPPFPDLVAAETHEQPGVFVMC